jgi:hypothetical protein
VRPITKVTVWFFDEGQATYDVVDVSVGSGVWFVLQTVTGKMLGWNISQIAKWEATGPELVDTGS